MSSARLLVQLAEDDLRKIVRGEVTALLAEERPAEPPPVLLDREQLARQLSISSKTLDRLRGRPGFPEVRLGDSPRFFVADVLAWLKASGAGLRLVPKAAP